MEKVILFDIDGTVADLSHRLHYVKNGVNDWESFNKNIPFDTPIEQTIKLHNILSEHYKIIFASGRSEDEREMTEKQLADFGCGYEKLYMRPAGDYRADHIIKIELLEQMRADGFEPYIVIDDRSTVVQAWREHGLFVLQCDPNRGECRSDVYKFHKCVLEEEIPPLVLLVGPTCSGKSSFVSREGIAGMTVSSDDIRDMILGDRTDQSQNNRVFDILKELVVKRLQLGLPTVVDCTNIKNKDRISIAKLIPEDFKVLYMVFDRPLGDKLKDKGWRNEDVIRRHRDTFNSNLKDILVGDGLPNVIVKDYRTI